MNNKKIIAFIGLFIAAILWGLSYVFSKGLLEANMGSITIIFIRSLIASVCLLLLMLVTGNFTIVKKEHWKTMILLSSFQPFLYFIFELYSMKYNSATLTSLVVSTVPLFIPLLLFIFEREKVSFRIFFGILISIVGVSIVLLTGSQGISSLMTDPTGLILAFFAVLCAAMYSITSRKLTKHYNALVITTHQNIIAFVLFTPIFFIVDFEGFDKIPLNQSTITSLLLLGIFCSAFAYMLYLNSVKYCGVIYSSMVSNLSSVFTVVGTYFMFGEKLTIFQMVGILVTLSGLYLGTFHSLIKKK